ncbi:LysR family transcriptional regulator [Pendulispora rubella]|uniref:LysR family transcriptional regulator n=1 Tax=Pendulispora rubella TaxID=2741070 RepID=A0ABZ2KUG6_9BACT
MDPTRLRYFQAIARHGNLTAAARELRVSQPTLTVAVRSLEEHLKTTLLFRDRDGVRLTTTGKELLDYAGEILALIEQAEHRIGHAETEERGHYVIGASTLGTYFLPRFMRGFLRKAPGIELTLWYGSPEEIARAVVDRTVHFGLLALPLKHPELVLVELFADSTELFVAPRKGAKPVTAAAAHERVKQGPLMYLAALPTSTVLLAQLHERNLTPARRLPCGTLHLVKSLAQEDVGVAILPRRVATKVGEDPLVALHESLPFTRDRIHLAYRSDLHRTRAALLIKDELIAYGKRLKPLPRD